MTRAYLWYIINTSQSYWLDNKGAPSEYHWVDDEGLTPATDCYARVVA